MSDRVPRKSTVEKSRLLQEKLEARAKAKEIRSLESATKAKKSTVEPENIVNLLPWLEWAYIKAKENNA